MSLEVYKLIIWTVGGIFFTLNLIFTKEECDNKYLIFCYYMAWVALMAELLINLGL